MKKIVLLFLFCFFIGIFCQSPTGYTVKWYTQKVDHASYSNNDTFQQRYIIKDKYWKKNGPILFYAGNEGDIFVFANNTGLMWENAAKFDAMIIFVEHRYYGESLPYGDKSFKNLKYVGFLTVEQALADYARFITDFKQTIYPQAAHSPVVIIGGSYGGMLAAWFRIKYPHLCVGALASSAPILQFPKIYDCSQYEQIVTRDYSDYSPSCSSSIRNSWKALRRLGATSNGLQWITDTFKLCKPLKQIDDFIAWIGGAWDSMAMTDYPNPATFLAPLPEYPIAHSCKFLTSPQADDKKLLKTIYQASNIFFNYTGETECNDISASGILDAMDGWNFQSCTEMVLPICSDGVNDMFEPSPWNFTKFSQDCKQKYGIGSEENKALTLFGGKNLKTTTNIIFSNGERDPWNAGGVMTTEHVSEENVVIVIPHACHHEDLRWSGPNDSNQLKQARKIELIQLLKWFKEYYSTNDISFKFSNANF